MIPGYSFGWERWVGDPGGIKGRSALETDSSGPAFSRKLQSKLCLFFCAPVLPTPLHVLCVFAEQKRRHGCKPHYEIIMLISPQISFPLRWKIKNSPPPNLRPSLTHKGPEVEVFAPISPPNRNNSFLWLFPYFFSLLCALSLFLFLCVFMLFLQYINICMNKFIFYLCFYYYCSVIFIYYFSLYSFALSFYSHLLCFCVNGFF